MQPFMQIHPSVLFRNSAICEPNYEEDHPIGTLISGWHVIGLATQDYTTVCGYCVAIYHINNLYMISVTDKDAI